MDDNVYKIAIAAFLHDIGKFAERASAERKDASDSEEINPAFYINEKFLNDNMDLYQPHYNGRYTHKHAVYTAAFIDHIEKLLPKEFNRGNWGFDDSFINLSAGHHNPKTPLQWIVAMADRISSGFDRDEFENYNKEIGYRDYKKTRLLTIFEGIDPDSNWKDDNLESFMFRYPLKELSPLTIFPDDSISSKAIDSDEASKEYRELFFEFVNALEKLEHKNSIPLWFEHFDSLFMIYASHIPAATVGKVIPDVSLYDHSKTTAAIATSIYLYHVQNDTLDVKSIKDDYDDKKFLILTGDFYGIQNFIFSEGGSTNKASAKLLRGRSFTVSLLSELSAYMLCQEIGLPSSSIVLNAAGKFTILAPNTKGTKDKISTVEEEINKWLIRWFYGEVSIGLSFIEASCNDFNSDKFKDLLEMLSKVSERKKLSKINLEKYGGAIDGYLNLFNNELDSKVCPFCGRRPSDIETEGDSLLGADKSSSCKICRDHIYIGTNLVKKERIAVTTVDADIHGKKQKLCEPFFGKYQVTFDVTGGLNELASNNSLLKYWDISIPKDGSISKEVTAKFINGYVPMYTGKDKDDLRLLAGKKSDKTKEELIEAINEGAPKTFLHIAKKSLNSSDELDKFIGIEAIGILKADVDNLGMVFGCGLKHYSISRLATLSRQLNFYFSVYLPYILKTNDRFRDIYTVFAGGDDLFLIGPWNRIIEFASFLNKNFSKYVCENKSITISAGVTVNKPGEPVPSIADKAETALKKAKDNGRDSITVFEETVKWEQFSELDNIREAMEMWLNKEIINNQMLFRFSNFAIMAKREQEILKEKILNIDDWNFLKWRALFKYTIARNVGKKLKGQERENAISQTDEAANWFVKYYGAVKIPVWQIIYNKR